jgi:O-methyltransferase domain
MNGTFGCDPAANKPPAVAAAYDFSGLTTMVDVGGATGNLLTTILGSYPESRGILYDLPHVVCDAPRSENMARCSARRVYASHGLCPPNRP